LSIIEELNKILNCDESFSNAKGEIIDNQHKDYVSYYSSHYPLSVDFIVAYKDMYDIDISSQCFLNTQLTEEFVREFIDEVSFLGLVETKKLSLSFIKDYLNRFERWYFFKNPCYTEQEFDEIMKLFDMYEELI
jgi:hypothetical protein